MPTHAFSLAPAESRTGETFDIFGDLVTIKVGADDAGQALCIMQGVTPPGGGPPLHTHVSDHETFVVMDGRFLFVLDGERVEATSGTVVHIPPGVAHHYQNIGDAPGTTLIVLAPPGLDAFFRELDALLRASAEPDMPAIDALHRKYRMELLGPPLSAIG